MELDSHADTCVLGKNVLLFMDHERPGNVVGYDKSCGTQQRDLPTVSGALAYNDANSGTAIMIIVHQAMSVAMMSNNLLCPMQIRMNDVELNDTSKFLTEIPTNKTRAISGRDQDGRKHIIHFTLRGVTSYIPTHNPLIEEFETCPRIELKYKSPEWDPHQRPSNTRKRPSWTIKDLSEMHPHQSRGD